MKQFTVRFVTISLTIAAFLLATYGLYVSADVLVYTTFLRQLVRQPGTFIQSMDAGFKTNPRHFLDKLDRAGLMQINDPLLI